MARQKADGAAEAHGRDLACIRAPDAADKLPTIFREKPRECYSRAMLEGLPPHAPTHVLRFDTDEGRARALTELLGEVFDPAETAVAAFEAEDGRTWHLEAYFSEEPDQDAIRELARSVVGDAIDGARFDTLAGADWVRASLDGLPPVRVWRFLVHGSHDRERVRPNDLAIEIEAALAFGTGHHGTTSGCLAALASELKTRRPQRVLDVGTGTGILAFAAAKALRSRVVAGDIDPIAIDVAKANARLNGVAPFLSLYVGSGTRHERAARSPRFDLVFANILARPLMRLARTIAPRLAPGGTLVLSGLLERDVPGVLSAYRTQGLALRRRSVREGWATLVLTHGGLSPRPKDIR
jgi:ribosomal protein L11 methyltransferase